MISAVYSLWRWLPDVSAGGRLRWLSKLDETNTLSQPDRVSDTVHLGSGKHGEGFSVYSRSFSAISMVIAVLAATVGLAGPASAAPAAWVMPDVRNMVLQQAIKEVRETTGGAELDLRTVDLKNGQEVINETNWEVCFQSPAAGKTISQKSKRVNLYVKRFNQQGCS